MTSRDVEWHGYRIPRGTRVALDLYGTNHDPRAWQDPERFDPERFLSGTPGLYSFIPQGGGYADLHHRCPGEPITTELMKVAVDMLARNIDSRVLEQDMRIDYTRLPALPRSKMVMQALQTNN